VNDDTTTPERDRAQHLLKALVGPTIRRDLASGHSPNYWRAVARALRAEGSPGPDLAGAIDEAVARFEAMRAGQEGGGS